MPAKRFIAIPLTDELAQILRDLLGVLAQPVTAGVLHTLLAAMSAPQFAPFRHTQVEAVETLLNELAEQGAITRTPDGTFQATPLEREELLNVFQNQTYANLASAIALAMPIAPNLSAETRDQYLRRDVRNAYYAQDTNLLNQAHRVIQNLYSDNTAECFWFDFIADEPMEWFRKLPTTFLAAFGWQFLPAAMLELQPIHQWVEVLYEQQDAMPPPVICSLIDYAILCGDWTVIPKLLKRLPQGAAPRTTRVACLRFLTGKDADAVSLFIDALESFRRETDSHHAYFRSIAGIFFVLALMRQNTPDTLNAAAQYANLGINERTPHTSLYRMLEVLAHSRAMPEFSFDAYEWTSTRPLTDCFACIAQYWMGGDLNPKQRKLLDELTERTANGAYRWLAEECSELTQRLANSRTAPPPKSHPGGNLPLVLDCIPNENSWGERFGRIARTMSDLPARTFHRLAWQVKFEGEPPTVTIRPIEQHAGKNGHWSRGRRFTGYQKDFFAAAGILADDVDYGVELTPQDKFACDALHNLEELLRQTPPPPPEETRNATAKLLQALVGHPHIFLETNDNRAAICVEATPRIHITENLAARRYALQPTPPKTGHLLPKLENGSTIALYDFSDELRKLGQLLGDDFQIPANAPENRTILAQLIQHFTVISDLPLELPEIAPTPTDTTPTLRLIPQDRGLKVEIVVSPFSAKTKNDFFAPGEGPVEMIFRQQRHIVRLVRDPQAEQDAAREIVAECPQLAADNQDEPWHWTLEGNACYDFSFLLHELANRCHVMWPEGNRFLCRKTLSLGNVSLRTQSYQSWFAIDGEARLNDSDGTISLSDLIQAAAEQKRFVELSDGQVVALSESLRKRLENLGRTGELVKAPETKTLQLQVCRFLAPFIASELNGFTLAGDSPEYLKWIQQYDEAMKIAPEAPPELKATLRPYQKDGFVWLARLDQAHAGACLADDMGLGKTLQAISLLLAHASEGPCLVVAPTSVCANWLAELQRFAPSIECSVFGIGNRAQTFKLLKAGQVLVTSYGLLQSENALFRKVHWRIAVLDEAQAIKNSHAKRSKAALSINADFRVVTTGTPVENNLTELWSIFNFILPGLLGSRENFQRRFAAPIEHDENNDAAAHLRSIVSPFLLRRRKEQVLAELPPKEDIDYLVELSPEEKEFYNKLRLSILNDLETHQESDNQRHIRVLAGITKLRLAVDHPSLVDGGANLPGSKLEAFMGLLKQVLENGHKVLVFSQFVKFLAVVRTTLDNAGIIYEYLDGAQNARDRATAVKNFQEGNVPVFLISLKAGGLGLNLTQADYVIHLDSWWNPAVENQASDRAHRLGQDKKVTIYHLQTAHTIEDKIKALHQRKRDLADQLLSDSDTIQTKSLEELLRLLREE